MQSYYSKYNSQTSLIWQLIRNTDSQRLYFTPIEPEPLFNKIPRLLVCTIKFRKYLSVTGLLWPGSHLLFFLFTPGHCVFWKYQTDLGGIVSFNPVLSTNTSLVFKDLSLEQFLLWSFPSFSRWLILPLFEDFHCAWKTAVLKLHIYLLLLSARL